jgi:hypothetical protein
MRYEGKIHTKCISGVIVTSLPFCRQSGALFCVLYFFGLLFAVKKSFACCLVFLEVWVGEAMTGESGVVYS